MITKRDPRPPEYRYWKQLMAHLKGDTNVFFNGELVYPRQFEIHLPGNHIVPCDLHCPHCAGKYFQKDLGTWEMDGLELLNKLEGKIPYHIYGGAYTEPLMNPYYMTFLHMTKRYGNHFGIHTNGALLSRLEEQSGWLTELNRISTDKVDYLSVSLDAGFPWSWAKTKGTKNEYLFNEIIQGMRKAVEIRKKTGKGHAIRLCYLISPDSDSLENFSTIVNITKEIGVDSLRFSIPFACYNQSFDKVREYKRDREVPMTDVYEQRLAPYLSSSMDERPYIFYTGPEFTDVDKFDFKQCVYCYYQITYGADGYVYKCSTTATPTMAMCRVGKITSDLDEFHRLLMKNANPNWDAIGVDCEIRVVDMEDLSSRTYNREYEQMICIPYGWEIIPRYNLWQWQNWLNELERSHLGHQGHGVYRRDFNLREDFIKRLAQYQDEDDEQRIMSKLTLGDFSIPVTVGDWGGIKSYGNIDLTVVDIMQPLKKGWNLISTPVTLDDNYATWVNLVTLGDGLHFDDAIRYDKTLDEFGRWVGLGEEPLYKLKPLEAIYVHATENDQIGIIFNRGVTTPPMLELEWGWNLVGLAISPDKWDSMPVNEALVSVEEVYGERGYSSVVSPYQQVAYEEAYHYQGTEGSYWFNKYGWHFEQSPWVYTVVSDDIKEMSIGGGYWVFMQDSGMLAGSSTTPVTIVNPYEPGHDLDPLVPRYDRERVTRTRYEEYHDEGYTKIYLTYSGDVSPGQVVEFYKQKMAEYGWELTAWEGSEDSASLDFALVIGDATASCHIDVVGGEGIDILFELWEPGVDLPDVPRFEWRPVVMTAYGQTTDAFDTQTNISYEGDMWPDPVGDFYRRHMRDYDWGECIGEGYKEGEFAWFIFRRHDEEGRTYICLIWAERDIIEIEHRVFAPSVPEEYIDVVLSLWFDEMIMRKWAFWEPPEEPEEP